jgi:hypothetical protein
MNRDLVCTAFYGKLRGLNRIWIGDTPSLSYGGNVIDIYAEQNHFFIPAIEPVSCQDLTPFD